MDLVCTSGRPFVLIEVRVVANVAESNFVPSGELVLFPKLVLMACTAKFKVYTR